MKHQVLFCLSIVSFLSYSMERGNAVIVADTYYAVESFRYERQGLLVPVEIQKRREKLANLSISRQEEIESLNIIRQAVEKEGSLKDLIAWSELRERPKKTRQIR